jgi:MFS family permease
MYLQTVVGLTPTTAGLTLIMLMIALNVSAGLSGYVIGRVVHYKLLPMIGLVVAISAILVLAWRVDSLNLITFQILLFLIGTGFGPTPGLSQVALQNSVARHQLGISVGTMTFSRNLLSTFLIAVFGAIVAGVTVRAGQAAPGALGAALTQDAAMAAQAYRLVFFAVAATMALAFVATLLLEEKPLQSGVSEAK